MKAGLGTRVRARRNLACLVCAVWSCDVRVGVNACGVRDVLMRLCVGMRVCVRTCHSARNQFLPLRATTRTPSSMHIYKVGLALCLFILGINGQCGNAGEDYYDLRNIFANNYQSIYQPSWIFNLNNIGGPAASSYCQPLTTSSCNMTCDPTFENRKVNTYDFSCSVTNLTAVNAAIANLTSFNVGGFNDSCTCVLPPTPAGQYLNGYTVNVYGKIVGFLDGTVNYYKACEVTPAYQTTPLAVGSTFSQIFVLNSSTHITASLFAMLCFVLGSIMLV